MTTLYGVNVDYDTNIQSLITIDSSTGITTIVAEFSGLSSNQLTQGIAIDENNNCFIIATDNESHATSSFLYKCNLETAELTFIGSHDLAPDIHDITASCDGTLYGTDSSKLNLYEINKENGITTLIGNLGYDLDKSAVSMTYDRGTDTIYQYVLHSTGYHTAFAKLDKSTGNATPVSELFNYGRHIGAIKSTCPTPAETFKLNPGFNGSWYNPETGGQGFLIDVLPKSNSMFVAWFTFANSVDTGKATAIGSPDQRWLTAQGELGDTNSLSLTIYNTDGGIFNDPTSVQSNPVGIMTIRFDNCSVGTVEFAIDNNSISGTIPIKRIVNDNVELCESLMKTVK